MPEQSDADIWNSHAVQAAIKRQGRLIELSHRTRGDRASYTANNIPCYVEPTRDQNGRDIYPPGYHYHKYIITREWGGTVDPWDYCQNRVRSDGELQQLHAERHRRYYLAHDELRVQMQDWWYHSTIKPLVHLPKLGFWRSVGDWLVGGFGPTPGEWDVWKAFFAEKEKAFKSAKERR